MNPPPLRRHVTAYKRQPSIRGPNPLLEDWLSVLFGDFFLCFNAGFLNMITINSYYKLATSHVTGLVAKVSQSIGQDAWELAWMPFLAWLFFLLGATITGFVVYYEPFRRGDKYGQMILLIAAVEAIALIIEEVKSDIDNQFVLACALACGIQNSLTSKFSNNVIRTTHMTGATTDLGVVLGHVLRGRRDEIWKIQLHCTALLGFFVGGIAGMKAYMRWGAWSMLFNVIITFTVGIILLCVNYYLRNGIICPEWLSTLLTKRFTRKESAEEPVLECVEQDSSSAASNLPDAVSVQIDSTSATQI